MREMHPIPPLFLPYPTLTRSGGDRHSQGTRHRVSVERPPLERPAERRSTPRDQGDHRGVDPVLHDRDEA